MKYIAMVGVKHDVIFILKISEITTRVKTLEQKQNNTGGNNETDK